MYVYVVRRVMPELPEGVELGPLDYMKNIREVNKCKPFKWYDQGPLHIFLCL